LGEEFFFFLDFLEIEDWRLEIKNRTTLRRSRGD
jgi:hypothetical protein